MKLLSMIIAMSIVAGMTYVFLPSIERAKKNTEEVVSMNNLKVIGQSVALYCNFDYESVPQSLDNLRGSLDAGTKFDDLIRSYRKPSQFDGPSFIYLSGYTMKDYEVRSCDKLLCFENPIFIEGDIPVVFLDGHVELMNISSFIKYLKKAVKLTESNLEEVFWDNIGYEYSVSSNWEEIQQEFGL